MEMHGAALERILTLTAEWERDAPGLLDKLTEDELIGNLLILHGMHPLHLETRLEQALAGIDKILRGYGARVEILGVPDGAVRLRVEGVVDAAVAKATRSEIEEALSEAVPDASSIVILGLEQFSPSDFVGVDQIRMAPATAAVSACASSGD
jgi:hypothetical protein